MGGMSSNVTDMSKFLSWQMKLLYKNNSEIINSNTLHEMQRVQFLDQEWGWGLGFEIYRKEGHTFIGHGGGQIGYRTQTCLDPKEKIGVIVCINSLDGEPYHGQSWSITDRIFEWMTPAIKLAAAEKAGNAAPKINKDIEGIYSSIWEETFVQSNGDKLMIMNPNTPDPKIGAWVLEPVSENTFRIVSAPRYLEIGENIVFQRNEQGKVTGYESGVSGNRMIKLHK